MHKSPSNKLTLEIFIERAKKKHEDKYDYSLVEYTNIFGMVKIICPKEKHGLFEQVAHSHLKGHGCSVCYNEKRGASQRFSVEEFVKIAKEKHGDKYDYSLVNYVNTQTEVTLFCNKHKMFFEQRPDKHLIGHGCKICGEEIYKNAKRSNAQEFIEKAKIINGDRYDYSLVEYINSNTHVTIICNEHGSFPQAPDKHLLGQQCPECSKCKKLTTEIFIERSNIVHNNKYDYSLVDYNSHNDKVAINCEEHGIFYQNAGSHLIGIGCKFCNESHGEKTIVSYLKKHSIIYEREKQFDGCRYKRLLSFDFYLPDYNITIEYDGKHHFEPIEQFGGIESFKKVQIRDNIKNKYCLKEQITLIRIRYDEDVTEKLNKAIRLLGWDSRRDLELAMGQV